MAPIRTVRPVMYAHDGSRLDTALAGVAGGHGASGREHQAVVIAATSGPAAHTKEIESS